MARENAQIFDFLKKFQENPKSRIFAPLAEAYRKAGMVDEAIEIAREGLQVHPHFVGGKVALARALFDKQQYESVVDELAEAVRDVPDNIVAQRLLGDSCIMLGRVAEALDAYKMLLFFSPHDQEVALIVKELEAQAYEQGTLVLRQDPVASDFSIEAAQDLAPTLAPPRPPVDTTAIVRKVELLQSLLGRVERYRQSSV